MVANDPCLYHFITLTIEGGQRFGSHILVLKINEHGAINHNLDVVVLLLLLLRGLPRKRCTVQVSIFELFPRTRFAANFATKEEHVMYM